MDIVSKRFEWAVLAVVFVPVLLLLAYGISTGSAYLSEAALGGLCVVPGCLCAYEIRGSRAVRVVVVLSLLLIMVPLLLGALLAVTGSGEWVVSYWHHWSVSAVYWGFTYGFTGTSFARVIDRWLERAGLGAGSMQRPKRRPRSQGISKSGSNRP